MRLAPLAEEFGWEVALGKRTVCDIASASFRRRDEDLYN
jgi:hypothetical protein